MLGRNGGDKPRLSGLEGWGVQVLGVVVPALFLLVTADAEADLTLGKNTIVDLIFGPGEGAKDLDSLWARNVPMSFMP
jgi:hypothetical protein